VAVVSAVAVWDGPEDLAVGEGQRGERSRDSGATAGQSSRRVVLAGARA
jgi:hypothetical protein